MEVWDRCIIVPAERDGWVLAGSEYLCDDTTSGLLHWLGEAAQHIDVDAHCRIRQRYSSRNAFMIDKN